jgi:peroxiredoxin
MSQLIESNEIADAVAQRGYSLVGLSYDPPSSLARFSSDEDIRYTLVSDEQSEFIDAVELRDPQYSKDPEANGVPYATVMLIGADGTVQSKMVSSDYRQRPSNDYVLEMIDAALE